MPILDYGISTIFQNFHIKQHDKIGTYELEGNEAYGGVLPALEVHIFARASFIGPDQHVGYFSRLIIDISTF